MVTNVYSLPNEILVNILSSFSTVELLPLTVVSHRFYALICRILHFRLLVAAPIPSRHLILECYHPTSRLSSPYAFCTYLGTDGLSAEYNGKGSIYENCEVTERLGRLCGLYSRFRPHVQVEESLQLLQSSEQTSGASVTDTNTVSVEGNNRVREQGQTNTASVRRLVSLEGGEGFSQLCIVVDLVKVKEGSGLLLSVTTVEDGVIRLWRDWLKERSKGDQDNEEEGVLWVGSAKHVGLKLRVREQRWNRNAPILVHRDEEPAVSYDVDIEEIWIRTIRLLITIERSMQEQENSSNAVIVGAVRRPNE
ncbi:hypothetical protein VTN31DRAFT_3037 [Thermomyces dupontii]|uniref:uncharacterized protein n=1 Tax=Talaromyces thermophilus TaxID=28565 RepID=UPI003743DE93